MSVGRKKKRMVGRRISVKSRKYIKNEINLQVTTGTKLIMKRKRDSD